MIVLVKPRLHKKTQPMHTQSTKLLVMYIYSSQNQVRLFCVSLTGLVLLVFFFLCFLHLLSFRFLDRHASRSNASPKKRFIGKPSAEKVTHKCVYVPVCARVCLTTDNWQRQTEKVVSFLVVSRANVSVCKGRKYKYKSVGQ